MSSLVVGAIPFTRRVQEHRSPGGTDASSKRLLDEAKQAGGLLVGEAGGVSGDSVADVVTGGAMSVLGAGWASRSREAGFRCTGRLTGLRAQVAKPGGSCFNLVGLAAMIFNFNYLSTRLHSHAS